MEAVAFLLPVWGSGRPICSPYSELVRMVRIFRYAPIGLAEDYCRLGWVSSPALEGIYHGEFAVLMEWMCGCPALEPVPVEGKHAKTTTT